MIKLIKQSSLSDYALFQMEIRPDINFSPLDMISRYPNI